VIEPRVDCVTIYKLKSEDSGGALECSILLESQVFFLVNALMAVEIGNFDSSLCPRYLLTEVRIHHLL
jgi:hypothetical protein